MTFSGTANSPSEELLGQHLIETYFARVLMLSKRKDRGCRKRLSGVHSAT